MSGPGSTHAGIGTSMGPGTGAGGGAGGGGGSAAAAGAGGIVLGQQGMQGMGSPMGGGGGGGIPGMGMAGMSPVMNSVAGIGQGMAAMGVVQGMSGMSPMSGMGMQQPQPQQHLHQVGHQQGLQQQILQQQQLLQQQQQQQQEAAQMKLHGTIDGLVARVTDLEGFREKSMAAIQQLQELFKQMVSPLVVRIDHAEANIDEGKKVAAAQVKEVDALAKQNAERGERIVQQINIAATNINALNQRIKIAEAVVVELPQRVGVIEAQALDTLRLQGDVAGVGQIVEQLHGQVAAVAHRTAAVEAQGQQLVQDVGSVSVALGQTHAGMQEGLSIAMTGVNQGMQSMDATVRQHHAVLGNIQEVVRGLVCNNQALERSVSAVVDTAAAAAASTVAAASASVIPHYKPEGVSASSLSPAPLLVVADSGQVVAAAAPPASAGLVDLQGIGEISPLAPVALIEVEVPELLRSVNSEKEVAAAPVAWAGADAHADSYAAAAVDDDDARADSHGDTADAADADADATADAHVDARAEADPYANAAAEANAEAHGEDVAEAVAPAVAPAVAVAPSVPPAVTEPPLAESMTQRATPHTTPMGPGATCPTTSMAGTPVDDAGNQGSSAATGEPATEDSVSGASAAPWSGGARGMPSLLPSSTEAEDVSAAVSDYIGGGGDDAAAPDSLPPPVSEVVAEPVKDLEQGADVIPVEEEEQPSAPETAVEPAEDPAVASSDAAVAVVPYADEGGGGATKAVTAATGKAFAAATGKAVVVGDEDEDGCLYYHPNGTWAFRRQTGETIAVNIQSAAEAQVSGMFRLRERNASLFVVCTPEQLVSFTTDRGLVSNIEKVSDSKPLVATSRWGDIIGLVSVVGSTELRYRFMDARSAKYAVSSECEWSAPLVVETIVAKEGAGGVPSPQHGDRGHRRARVRVRLARPPARRIRRRAGEQRVGSDVHVGFGARRPRDDVRRQVAAPARARHVVAHCVHGARACLHDGARRGGRTCSWAARWSGPCMSRAYCWATLLRARTKCATWSLRSRRWWATGSSAVWAATAAAAGAGMSGWTRPREGSGAS